MVQEAQSSEGNTRPEDVFNVVIVGGGSAGISVAASLLKRDRTLRIGIIEPSDKHYYQPAWTLVGGGAYDVSKTVRPTRSVIPTGAHWIQAAATQLDPQNDRVVLTDGSVVRYEQLIVCPGLRLAWEKIAGLEETLGKNGVTSNYRYDLAPYTWQLVSRFKGGTALFTQPPMPIKCAGAPQKALYLSCDHWQRHGLLDQVKAEFMLAGKALFGVTEFVPPLMEYVKKYNAVLNYDTNLVKVDGSHKTAWFDVTDADGNVRQIERQFDLLHVVPPQVPFDFVKNSPLANAAGWCEVDHATLQSPRHANVFSLGDICSAPNTKTAAAVRKQVVIVARNVIAQRRQQALPAQYDGYGACPLTVEKGKVVLAEFIYGGKLTPTFPLKPTVARRSAWFLKATVLPWVYWNLMLKGHEWLTKSRIGDKS